MAFTKVKMKTTHVTTHPGKFRLCLFLFIFVYILSYSFFLVWKPSLPLHSTLNSPPPLTLALNKRFEHYMHTRLGGLGSLLSSCRMSTVNSCYHEHTTFPTEKRKMNQIIRWRHTIHLFTTVIATFDDVYNLFLV